MKNKGYLGEIFQQNATLKLDKKNQKILSLLTKDARTSLTQLSQEVKLSKSNIARRISQLEEKNVIGGYHAFTNGERIGLIPTILLIKTSCNAESKEKYIQKVLKEKFAYSVVEVAGFYDIIITYYETENILDLLLDKEIFKEFHVEKFSTIFSPLDYTDTKSQEYYSQKKNMNSTVLDKLDAVLLEQLTRNCRQTYVDLANKLNSSREVIKYRVQRLINNKIIGKFQPTINFFLLGYDSYAMNFQLIKPSQKKNLIEYLWRTNRCNTILEFDNSCELMCFIHFKSNVEFREFEKELFEQFQEAIFDFDFSLVKQMYKLEWFNKNLITF